MGCGFDEKILHLYVDNELSEPARAKLADHLAYCADCRATVEAIHAMKTGLAAACSAIRAPEYLYVRILNNLEAIPANRQLKLSLKEKLKLLSLNFRISRRWAMGFVFSLILIFIIFPGKQNLHNLAGELAREHMARPAYGEAAALQTNEASEVIDFLKQKLGFISDIPQHIQSKYKLEGARVLKIEGNSVAQVRYSDGLSGCSMFIINNLFLEYDNTELYIASGVEFKVCNSGDCNLICWENDRNCYILCGNCCFKDLVNMAVSFI